MGPGLDERARDLVTKIPGGTPIQIPAHYPEFASYYPECELQTKKWFIDNVRQEWICVDAGANIGYHSILMARLAQSGTVYAFEPTDTHDFLVSNIEANNASNVTPLRLGLSDRSFRGEESIFRIWGHDPEVTEVEFVTLDEFAVRVGLERLDLIKIDVDGFDLEVLWGAESVLKRFQPTVIVELNHALLTRGYTPSQAISWLVAQGYRSALVLDSDNWVFSPHGDNSDLRISIDSTDPWLLLQGEPSGDAEVLDIRDAQLHNEAVVVEERIFELTGPRWSYAVTLKLPRNSGEVRGVRLSGVVEHGDLGAFLSDLQGSTVMGHEYLLKDAEGAFDVYLPAIQDTAELLVLRKITGRALRIRINEVAVYS